MIQTVKTSFFKQKRRDTDNTDVYKEIGSMVSSIYIDTYKVHFLSFLKFLRANCLM